MLRLSAEWDITGRINRDNIFLDFSAAKTRIDFVSIGESSTYLFRRICTVNAYTQTKLNKG